MLQPWLLMAIGTSALAVPTATIITADTAIDNNLSIFPPPDSPDSYEAS
jgi:hypothetical protein